TLGARDIQRGLFDDSLIREANIELALRTGDPRKNAVPNLPARFVLVEPESQIRLLESTRLRRAEPDYIRHGIRDRIGGAAVVLSRAPKERHDIAHRGHADTQYQRVFCRIDQLIQECRIEATF